MNSIICIKQVPDPKYFDKIVLDPKTKLVRREGVPSVLNNIDANAVEAAMRIKDSYGGTAKAITMGPPQADEILEEVMAMGVDEGILLSDRAFAGADATATAKTLAAAIKKSGKYDLILCGYETVDSGTRQIGPQLAEYLGLPHVANVSSITFINEKTVLAYRKLDNSTLKIDLDLPAVIAVNSSINTPRIPTVMGILDMVLKKITLYKMGDVEIDPKEIGLEGSPTQMSHIREFKQNRLRELFSGDPGDVVQKAIAKIKEMQMVP